MKVSKSVSGEYGASEKLRGLESLVLKPEYRSDRDNLVRDFYVPCLRESQLYLRAVGFFTSQGLSVAAQGLTEFIARGGSMRLAASPLLEAEDIEAIERGYAARQDIVKKALLRQIEKIPDAVTQDRLGYLAWLISEKHLEMKIAIPLSDQDVPKLGIYHEKLGIFQDDSGNEVAFTGSPNETRGGLVNNFETIDVFWSWDDPQQRVSQKRENFERLWQDDTLGLSVMPFPDAVREKILSFKPDKLPTRFSFHGEPTLCPSSGRPTLPVNLSLRDYQEEAIRSWFLSNGRGILKMATGGGKTITALAALEKLYSSGVELRCAVIICPYRHLVVQWEEECHRFGLRPLLAFESRKNWSSRLTEQLNHAAEDPSHFFTVLTTNATFSGECFQRALDHFPERTLLVADEAHNLGASKLARCLPDFVAWRLALSATPERWYDEEGTDALFKYFGTTLKPEFTLKDALSCRVLTPYRYYPLLVHLSEDEAEEYCDITEKVLNIVRQTKENEEPPEVLTRLLVKRARLVATARNKLGALRELGRELQNASHMLFYCGDGSVEDEQSGVIFRHIEAVTRLLGREMGMRVAKYTAETPLDTRSKLRKQFDEGHIQGLVAIRCLDEGVDIPSIRTAVILASSTNPRQFIQRRGRILRRSPGKEAAAIYDMITLPPDNTVELLSATSLLRREFTRFAEFASLALNAGEARGCILGLQKKYGLLDT